MSFKLAQGQSEEIEQKSKELDVKNGFFHSFFWPSLYLCLADSYAIANGIWSISPKYTLDLKFITLPVEEAVFFFATNIMVVLGLLLFLYMKKDMKAKFQSYL